MQLNLDTLLSLMGVGGVGIWVGKVLPQYLAGRSATKQTEIKVKGEVDQHHDSLTLELLRHAREDLRIAREDIIALKENVNRLQGLEAHMFHLEQAFEHIDALINATDENRSTLERNARAFLKRMRDLQASEGAVAQEQQIIASAAHLARKARDEQDNRLASDQ